MPVDSILTTRDISKFFIQRIQVDFVVIVKTTNFVACTVPIFEDIVRSTWFIGRDLPDGDE